MNPFREFFYLNLCEARFTLSALIEEIESSDKEVSPESVQRQMAEVFSHLAIAYNGKDMDLEDIIELKADDLAIMGSWMPRFFEAFSLPKSPPEQ